MLTNRIGPNVIMASALDSMLSSPKVKVTNLSYMSRIGLQQPKTECLQHCSIGGLLLWFLASFHLTSRKPLWCESEPVDINSQWRESWKSASVVNAHLVDDPTIRQPGFALPRQQWSLLNRFRTRQVTAVPVRRNGNFQTPISVPAVRPKQCHTLSNPAHRQDYTVACLNYTLQTMMPLSGWPVMAPNAYHSNIVIIIYIIVIIMIMQTFVIEMKAKCICMHWWCWLLTGTCHVRLILLCTTCPLRTPVMSVTPRSAACRSRFVNYERSAVQSVNGSLLLVLFHASSFFDCY